MAATGNVGRELDHQREQAGVELQMSSCEKDDHEHESLGVKKERSHSPTPSSVSMKSDESKGYLVTFKEGESSTGHVRKERSHSPTPSSLSMKSDESQEWPKRESSTGLYHHKSHLQKKFQCLNEGIPQQGVTRLLHEIYTELYITEGGGGDVNDEHEVRQIERASWRKAAQERPIKCRDLFKDILKEDRKRWQNKSEVIGIVLTKGVSGIGKTVSVQKFILEWAEGKANQDVHFIFPLPFRELNQMKEKNLSLLDLIMHFFSEIKDPRNVISSEHKVMFIFDGLDECRLPLNFLSNPRCTDVREPASVDVLLTNLIKGNLFPTALLWITTRPAAASQIPPTYVRQMTEIRGFNNPQKEEYFRKRISEEKLANKTITHLKSFRSLNIMCHIPLFCWILATVVESTSKESKKVDMPRSLTQMYTHFLIIQTTIKKDKYTERKQIDDKMFFKLGKLAFQQLEKGNLIFYEEDLKKCGIEITEASVYSGVCTQIFKEESGLSHGRLFSFVHLSIQEFLAALYVFLCFSNRQRYMPDQQQSSQLSALFRAATLHDLNKTAVDLALQSRNGHLDLFLRFLLGLSMEFSQNLLRHLLPQDSSQSQSSEQTVQYVKQKIGDQNRSDRRINLFYCLNELNHHAVVEDIDRSSRTLYVDMLLPGEWETKRFEFKMPEDQMAEFNLQKYIKTPEKDDTEFLSPDEVLQRLEPVVTTATSAWLRDCNLTEKSCSYLASALTSHSSSLRVLDLTGNELLDSGVERLCTGLCHQNGKLEKLWLQNCNLTQMSCSYLASVLTSQSSSLKELILNSNELLDSGVEVLCSAFCHQNCKLEELGLWGCKLTRKSCSYLASALNSHASSLRVLDLSANNLRESDVEQLSALMKDPQSKLKTLLWSF